MEIRQDDKIYIIAPLSSKLEERETARIIKEIEHENRAVAIDLSSVTDCTIDFIEKIKSLCSDKRIGIFNIPSDIFALFNIMKMDKYANLYVSELDFEENTRRIINRKFLVY